MTASVWRQCALVLTFAISTQPVTAADSFERAAHYDWLAVAFRTQTGDFDGDGRDEIVATSNSGFLWEFVEFEDASGDYRITRTAHPPFNGENDFLERGGAFDIGVLEPGGAPKVVVIGEQGNIYVTDLETGVVDYVSWLGQAHRSFTQVIIEDLDGDGIAEILLVSELGVSYMPFTLSQWRTLKVIDRTVGYAVAIGNVDDDAGLEMIATDGVVDEISNSTTAPEYTLPAQFMTMDANAVYLADTDGDGRDEAILHYTTGGFVAYDVELETSKWEVATDPIPGQRAQVVADADNDGLPDYLVSFNSSGPMPAEVRAYDGETGALLWQIDATAGTGSVVGLAVGRFDDDASAEVLISELRPFSGPDRWVSYDIDAAAIELQHEEDFPDYRAIAFSDVDGNGESDITIVAKHLTSPVRGDTVAYRFTADDLAHESVTYNWLGLDSLIKTGGVEALQIADVDGDGELEYVVGSDNGGFATLTVASTVTSNVEFELQLGNFGTVPVIDVANVDGDNQLEIIVMSGTIVSIIDGLTGAVEWESQPPTQAFGKANALIVGNIDGDPELEIVISTRGIGGVMVLDIADNTSWIGAKDGALGLALALPQPGGPDQIVVGYADGQVDVIEGVGFTVVSSTSPCDSEVNAVARNTLASANPNTVLITCDKWIAELDPFTGIMNTITGVLPNDAGIDNNLHVFVSASGEQRIGVSTQSGYQVLQPTANIKPVVTPVLPSSSQLAFFSRHWRGTSIVDLAGTFRDYDGPLPTLSVAPVDIDGTLIGPVNGSTSEFEFTPNPDFPQQYISFVATDGTDSSHVASLMVRLENQRPRAFDQRFNIEPGAQQRVDFSGEDFDNDPITFEVITQPAKGEIVELVENRYFVYRANSNETGEDIVEYVVSDSFEESFPVQIIFTIVEAPPPPPPPPTTPSGGGGGGLISVYALLALFFTAVRFRCGVRCVV